MNNDLRKCINVKNMLRCRYNVYKSKAKWEKYIEYRKRVHTEKEFTNYVERVYNTT